MTFSKKKRSIISIMLALLLAAALTLPAFASNIPDFTWSPQLTTQPTFVPVIEWKSGGLITFDGVARSTTSGSFKIQLQKQNIFGGWGNEGNTYTVTCHNGETFNPGYNTTVHGRWFKVSWGNRSSGTYRILLSEASISEDIRFSHLWFENQN